MFSKMAMQHTRQAPGRDDIHRHFSLVPARSHTITASSKASATATRSPPPHPDPYKLQDRAQARKATSRAPHLSLIPLSPPYPASKRNRTSGPATATCAPVPPQKHTPLSWVTRHHQPRPPPCRSSLVGGGGGSSTERTPFTFCPPPPRPSVRHRCQVFGPYYVGLVHTVVVVAVRFLLEHTSVYV